MSSKHEREDSSLEHEKKMYAKGLLLPYLSGEPGKPPKDIKGFGDIIKYLEKEHRKTLTFYQISPFYRAVTEHRRHCPFWNGMTIRGASAGCIECWGGGIKNLVSTIVKEIFERMDGNIVPTALKDIEK